MTAVSDGATPLEWVNTIPLSGRLEVLIRVRPKISSKKVLIVGIDHGDLFQREDAIFLQLNGPLIGVSFFPKVACTSRKDCKLNGQRNDGKPSFSMSEETPRGQGNLVTAATGS